MFDFNEKLAKIKACLDKAENLLREIENLAVPEQMKAVEEMFDRKGRLEKSNQKIKLQIFNSLIWIVRRMSIPMNEVGKDKFEFVTMGIGYKVTSELLRRENREVRLYDDKPIDHELTPLLVEIFEHVLQHVSKKLDEIPEEVEQEIAKTASWIEPLKKQMAPLEKKIRKAK